MAFNPYDYQRYARALPSPSGAHSLPPRAGMSHDDLHSYEDLRRRVEEVNRRQRWESVDGLLHSDRGKALDASNAAHQRWGLPNCGNRNDYP